MLRPGGWMALAFVLPLMLSACLGPSRDMQPPALTSLGSCPGMPDERAVGMLLIFPPKAATAWPGITHPTTRAPRMHASGDRKPYVTFAAFPRGTRLIAPNSAVTQDYREERLNVEVDAKGVITGIRCG